MTARFIAGLVLAATVLLASWRLTPQGAVSLVTIPASEQALLDSIHQRRSDGLRARPVVVVCRTCAASHALVRTLLRNVEQGHAVQRATYVTVDGVWNELLTLQKVSESDLLRLHGRYSGALVTPVLSVRIERAHERDSAAQFIGVHDVVRFMTGRK